MLRVDGLTKRYGALLALDDVTFDVRPGEVVGFLGPNGAGKTTTMRAIMGLVALDRGSVTWNDAVVDATARRRFGYMPAERGMYQRMKVRDHLVYYAEMSGLGGRSRAVVDGWLERLGLADRADDTVQALSSGNQQRVQLALALVNEPELLVLDEPFSGLDPIAVETLSDLLREQVARGVALLLSSHQLDLVADVCSSVVIVSRGAVVLRGDVTELRASSPRRHVVVEFAEPTTFEHDGAAMSVSAEGRRHSFDVTSDVDPSALLAAARRHGPVVSFTFAPPDLSDVFVESVGGSISSGGTA